MRFRLNSLAANISAVVLLASSISLAIFTSSVLVVDRMSSLSQLDSNLTMLADTVGLNSTAALLFDDKDAARETLRALRSDTSITTACLFDTSGSLFAEYQRNDEAPPCDSLKPLKIPLGAKHRTIVRPILLHSERLGSIWVTTDLKRINVRETQLLCFALALLAVALVFGVGAGVLLQFQITKPLLALAETIDEVTRGSSFARRAKVSGSNEIVRLAEDFNQMLAELERRDQIARAAEAQLAEQANTDALTGLPNRRSFSTRLEQTLAQATKDETTAGLLYIDLDGFKLVNDSLGHNIGDLLLCQVVERLLSRTPPENMLARVGGDEFCVILAQLQEERDAHEVAQALLQSLELPFLIDGHEISIAASIGISLSSNENRDGGELLRQADAAMYAAKQGGRNRAVLFAPALGAMARERLMLENQLRSAIARREIFLHYQPEFDLHNNRLVRFEALARWTHPHLGQVPPDKFIPIAEESGFIHLLGFHIFEMACQAAADWQRILPYPVQVAVNVSAVQFNSEAIVEEILMVLNRTGLDPSLLQIELTETVMLGSLQQSAEKMKRLRDLGVSLAIDDFGTGYSALSYLPDLPVDVIKIDRSFVRNLHPGSDAVAIMCSIVELAHSMKLSAVVEGVEDEAQLALARELGADTAQGYLLGRPGPDPETLLRSIAESPSPMAQESANPAPRFN
jgi:diguanylate cyclase (GGDEF)-like protein